ARRRSERKPGGWNESRERLDRLAAGLQGTDRRAGRARPAGVGCEGGPTSSWPHSGGIQGARRRAKGDGDRPEAIAEQEGGAGLEGAHQRFGRLRWLRRSKVRR